MDFCCFVGVDIAKYTPRGPRLDWAVYSQQDGLLVSPHTDNTLTAIRTVLTQLKALPSWNLAQAVFYTEHTGIYAAHLSELLYESALSVWLELSLQIKQAGGMQRGKTDKIDA